MQQESLSEIIEQFLNEKKSRHYDENYAFYNEIILKSFVLFSSGFLRKICVPRNGERGERGERREARETREGVDLDQSQFVST